MLTIKNFIRSMSEAPPNSTIAECMRFPKSGVGLQITIDIDVEIEKPVIEVEKKIIEIEVIKC